MLHTGKYLTYSTVRSEPNQPHSKGLGHRRLGIMNSALKNTTYLRRNTGTRQDERRRPVGKEEGIDDGRRREVWENNHREEMIYKGETGNSMETCGTP